MAELEYYPYINGLLNDEIEKLDKELYINSFRVEGIEKQKAKEEINLKIKFLERAIDEIDVMNDEPKWGK